MEIAALLTTVIPALLPGLIDAIKMGVSKLTGVGMADPKSVDDLIKLRQAESAHLKALAEIDRPTSDISRWVADLRASFRYVFIGLVILAYLSAVLFFAERIPADRLGQLETLAGQCLFFIIGDRVYLGLKKK